MTETTPTATELEARSDVARAVSTWETCDVAALVPDGTDIAPIRKGFQVADITDFSAAPYVLLELNHTNGVDA